MQVGAAEMPATVAAPSSPLRVLDIASSGSESEDAAIGWSPAKPAHHVAVDLVSDESDDHGEDQLLVELLPQEVSADVLTSFTQPSNCERIPANTIRNKDFCEVCQKTGRLLLCNTCPRAFHSRCVERFVDHKALAMNPRWTCPVCTQGTDVLHGLTSSAPLCGDLHLRMADSARRDRKQWRASERRRDAFLRQHSALLETMATKATLSRIQREATVLPMRGVPLKKEATPGRETPQRGATGSPKPDTLLKEEAALLPKPDILLKKEATLSPKPDTLQTKEATPVPKRDLAPAGETVRLDAEVLKKDAPQSHPVHQMMKISPKTDGCHLVAFRYPYGDKLGVHFQVTVFKSGGDYGHALRLARLCYLKFENGATKKEVTDYRNSLYEELASAGLHPKMPGEAVPCFQLSRPPKPDQPPAGFQPSLLEMGACVDVIGSGGSTYRAVVLAHPTPHLSSYIVANTHTKAEAVIDRQYLHEVIQPGECDRRDFLSYARKMVLAQGVTLKEYQVAGVNWLIHTCLNRCGGILADDMGLGKTVQALACLSYLRCSGTFRGPFLIVAPLSCIGNWVREAKRFVPHLSIAKLCGSAREKERALDDDEMWFGLKDIVITTYETTVATEDFLQRHFWSVLVLDEAHRIKNQASRIREALDTVKCASRLLLTGTPLQNNLGELFTLLKFLWPDVLLRVPESLENAARGAEPGADEALLGQLRVLLHMLMLRRLKENVIQLPPKVLRDVWLPLTPCQVTWYKALLRSRERADNRSLSLLLKFLNRLRQVFCHPCCLTSTDQDNADLERDELAGLLESSGTPRSPVICDGFLRQSSKLFFLDKLLMHLHTQNMCISPKWRRAFQERQHVQVASSSGSSPSKKNKMRFANAGAPFSPGIDAALFLSEAHPWKPPHSFQRSSHQEAADMKHPDNEESDHSEGMARPHKVLIFSQFLSCLDLLEMYCKWRGWRALRLDGSTHRVLRELDLRDFNSDDEDIFIYLLSTRAGGLGINLASANHVVLFDHDWNPQIDHQAIDRAHRITQERVVTVYRLIQEWSVEERLVARQEEKLRMERSVVEACGSSRNVGEQERLSAAEVLELLRYGEEAIQQLAGERLLKQPLRWFLDRLRRPLLKPQQLAATQQTSDESHRYMGKKHVGESPSASESSPRRKRAKHTASTITMPSQHRQQEQNTIVQWTASGRAVRQPAQFAVPSTPSPKAARKKMVLRHCRTCFVCGKGQLQTSPRRLAETDSSPELRRRTAAPSPEIFCAICPKAYHSRCLGPEALLCGRGGRWNCGWHSCADCGRTPSLCGGMLINCMKCPTALCYECFPPNFRRVHPPESFWADLNDRGWAVSPEKMVLFLCNSCREADEQSKQQEMCAEDLRARNDERQRAALEEQRRLAELKRIVEEEEAARQEVRQLMTGKAGGEIGPESSVQELKRELIERGLPIYGTKEQLWERLRAGKILKKPRGKRSAKSAGRRTRKLSLKRSKNQQRQKKLLRRQRSKNAGHPSRQKRKDGNSIDGFAHRRLTRKSADANTKRFELLKVQQMGHDGNPARCAASAATCATELLVQSTSPTSPRVRVQGKQSPKKCDLGSGEKL